MEGKEPSRTARGAAAHRAAHQTLEHASIFADPYACTILGVTAAEVAEQEAADPNRRPMRLFVAARSRFTDDCLAEAVARGVRQIVILGAGLDTFALRNPHAALGVQVFEVDHPATQIWKRDRLARSGLDVPASLTFVPVDFERESLAQALAAAGFAAGRTAFFVWLGVVPYLTRDAILATLRYIAGVPEAEVIFDYSEPLENYPPKRRARVEAAAARVASIGEPWLTHFDPPELARLLHAIGFARLEDMGPEDLAVRYFGAEPGATAPGGGGHVMRAQTRMATA
jgi:methyltransferase (TIGR00027 family)